MKFIIEFEHNFEKEAKQKSLRLLKADDMCSVLYDINEYLDKNIELYQDNNESYFQLNLIKEKLLDLLDERFINFDELWS
jgi:hypothetical protein